MGALIRKPDANPLVVAALNFIFCNGGAGYLLLGQRRKAIVALGATFLGTLVCGLGLLVPFFTAYDAFKLGQKLANGEAIGEEESVFPLFDRLLARLG